MAQVLGLVSSIITIFDLATSIFGGSCTSSNPPGLAQELQSLTEVLYALQEFSNKYPGSKASQGFNNGQDKPLQGCFKNVERLQSKLASRKGFKGMIDRFKRPREKEILEYIEKIEKYKSLLTHALIEEYTSLTRDIKTNAQSMSPIIQNLQTEGTYSISRESYN